MNKFDDKKTQYFIARIEDKIRNTKQKNKINITNFLDGYEQKLAVELLNKFKIQNYIEFGGYDKAERKIIIIYPDKLSGFIDPNIGQEFLSVIDIKLPNELKNTYKHKDYLGMIMKLGLSREKVGDILVRDNGADIIILKESEKFLLNNLNQLTRLKKSQIVSKNIQYLIIVEGQTKILRYIVPSLRLDCIVSEFTKTSREKAKKIFEQERVFLNYKMETMPSKNFQINDLISVRGKGRFKIIDIDKLNKSEKFGIKIEKNI